MNDMTPPALDGAPLEFNPLDPAFIADPYPFYRRLRETAPVFKTPQGLWLITRYDDVAFALRDKRFGKDFVGDLERRYGDLARMQEPAVASLGRTMLVLDPPDHTRLRALVTKAFTARRVADMRPRIKALVDAQLDRVIDSGGMDVMRDLAHRLPVIVICDMLGIPEEHRAPFLAGSNVNGRILEPVPMSREELDQANRNTQMAGVYFDQLCELRRREPQGRPHDRAGAGGGGGRQAHGRGAPGQYRPAVRRRPRDHHQPDRQRAAGAAPQSPDQWERLKADPSLIPNAIEELLRYDSSVQMTGRVTMAEVEIGGVTLPPNESVLTLLGAANRDPAQYAGSRHARCRPARTCGRCRSAAASIIAWAPSWRGSRPSWSSPPWSSACPTSNCPRRTRRHGGGSFTLRGLQQAAGGVALGPWRGRWPEAGGARAANIRAPARTKKTAGRSRPLGDGSLLAVVADGMGGHAGGAVASKLAVEAFVHALEQGGGLADGLHDANAAVGKGAAAKPDARRHGRDPGGGAGARRRGALDQRRRFAALPGVGRQARAAERRPFDGAADRRHGRARPAHGG